MDAANFTLTHDISCAPSPAVLSSNGLHVEKISCSFSPLGSIDPWQLLGLSVFVDEYQPASGHHDAQVFSYTCHVTGVLVGSSSLGRCSQICLRQPYSDRDELVPISRLTIRSIDQPNLVAFAS